MPNDYYTQKINELEIEVKVLRDSLDEVRIVLKDINDYFRCMGSTLDRKVKKIEEVGDLDSEEQAG
jgi:hypothetical protein